MSLQVKYAIYTHQGLIRSSNEDIIDAGVLHKVDTAGLQVTLQYMLVCDGMGGMKAGEAASHLAADTLMDYIKAMPFWPTLDADIECQLQLSVQAAHQNIKLLSDFDFDKSGMGTTIVLLIIVKNQAYVIWSGDSRAYLSSKVPQPTLGLHQDGMNLLTKDHSLVWSLIESHTLTLNQARNHPQSSMLNQSLGGAEIPMPGFLNIAVVDGDRFLLCSDGINRHLDTKEMYDILVNHTDINTSISLMTELVLHRGAKDNFSLGIVDVIGVQWAQPELTAHKANKSNKTLIINTLRWLWLIPIFALAYFGWQKYNGSYPFSNINKNQPTLTSDLIDTKMTNKINYQDSLIASIMYLDIAMDSLKSLNHQWTTVPKEASDTMAVTEQKTTVVIANVPEPQKSGKTAPKPAKKETQSEKAKLYDAIYKKVEVHFDEMKNKYPDPDNYIKAYFIRLELLLDEVKQKKKEKDFTNLTKTKWQIENLNNKFDMIQSKYQPE